MALSRHFHFICGVDTEFTRARVFDTELPAHDNAVVSYQAAVLVPETGVRFSTVAFPTGPRRVNRISLMRFISDAITQAVTHGAAGPETLEAIEAGDIKIALVAHFTRADLPGFRDFNRLKKRFDGIRKTYASTSSPAKLHIRLSTGRHIKASVTLTDTMLLAPAGAGSLRKLGELLGFDKLTIPAVTLPDGAQAPAIERMDMALKQHPEAFTRYATRDAEIAVEWACRAWELAEAWGLSKPPQTIASMAVKTFRHLAQAEGADLNALLGTVPKAKGRGAEPHPDYLHHQSFLACCFHGGRNECFAVGIFDGGFIDWDFAGAYTTALAQFRAFDWGRITPTTDLADLAQLDAATFAHVEFSFPPATRFPSLPVSAADNGLLFPLTGTSFCTGPELLVALNQDARICVLHGLYIPWKASNAPRPFVAFTAHINAERARFRKAHGKGSAMELLAKEAGNSLYGKTAQGVAAMRPKGIEGLNAKSAFNTRTGGTDTIPPSAITQPAIAALTTGLLRAVLSEALANLPDDVEVMSATTDGWLSTATAEQAAAATSGPVCRYFASLRALVSPDGDDTIIEQKHDASRVLSMKTRGAVTIARAPGSTSKPILARAGHRLDGDFASVEEEAAAFAELYRHRTSETVTTRRSFVSIRAQWMENADLYDTSGSSAVNLCFDLKRVPLDPHDADGLIRFTTAPWPDLDAFREARDRFDRWRKATASVLRTASDWQRFTASRGGCNRASASQRSPFQNAIIEHWAAGGAGLPVKRGRGRGVGLGREAIAAFLNKAGVPAVTADVLKKQRDRLAGSEPPTPTLSPATLSPDDCRLLEALQTFPAAHAAICATWFNPPLTAPSRKEQAMTDTNPNPTPKAAPLAAEAARRHPAARLAPGLYTRLMASACCITVRAGNSIGKYPLDMNVNGPMVSNRG
jgi:hypothetical protein